MTTSNILIYVAFLKGKNLKQAGFSACWRWREKDYAATGRVDVGAQLASFGTHVAKVSFCPSPSTVTLRQMKAGCAGEEQHALSSTRRVATIPTNSRLIGELQKEVNAAYEQLAGSKMYGHVAGSSGGQGERERKQKELARERGEKERQERGKGDWCTQAAHRIVPECQSQSRVHGQPSRARSRAVHLPHARLPRSARAHAVVREVVYLCICYVYYCYHHYYYYYYYY